MDYTIEKNIQSRIAENDLLFSALNDPALIYDRNLHVYRVNQLFAEKLGCNPEGMHIDEVSQLFSYHWMDIHFAGIQPTVNAIKGERSSGVRISITARGTELLVEESSSPVTENGQILGALTIWRIVSQGETSGNIIKHDLHRQIDHYLPVGAVTFRNGLVEYANQAAIKIFGFKSISELEGKDIQEILQTNIKDVNSQRIKHLQVGKYVEELEHKIVRADGEERIAELMLINTSDESNKVYHCFINDITSQKKMNLFHHVLSSMEQYLQSPLSILEIAQHAMEMVARALCCDSAAVSFLKENFWEVKHIYKFGDHVRGMVIPQEDETHANIALRDKKIVFIEDTYTDHRVNQERLKSWGIRSVIVVPLFTRNKKIGVIFFNYSKKKVFNHEEVYFLMRFSNSLSLALENAALFSHLQSELSLKQANEDKLKKLNNILLAISRSSRAMLHATSEKEYIRHICEIITGECKQALAWVGFPDGNRIIPWIWAGEARNYMIKLHIRIDRKPHSNGPTGMAFRNKVPYVCNNVQTDPAFEPWRKNASKHGINSAISLPLVHHGEVFGVLNIYAYEPNYYSSEEIILLTELSKLLSKGIISIRVDFAKNQAEEALRESEERFRMITEKSNALICELDAYGRVIYANAQYLNIFGWHVPFNDSIIDNCKPDDRTAFYNYIYSNEVKNSRSEWSLRDKDNKWRWFRCYPGIFKTSRGGKHFSMVMFDITETKHSEQQLRRNAIALRELNATKDKFFAIIAHDLKNPFTNLIGASEFLASGNTLEPETVQKLGRIINGSAHRGYNLLENLLDWSRSQTGAIAFNPRKILLCDLVRDCWDNIKPSAMIKEQMVEISIPEKLEVVADINMLNTVIRNLMQNAVKFTHNRGEIKIMARKGKKNITVSVEDNGMGMSPNDIKKLFRIDKKFSRPGTSNETGTGLGLLLCREFIEKHGGRIQVKSREGEGSAFIFTLPLVP